MIRDEGGQAMLRGRAPVSSGQAWFWDHEWQRGEREAGEQIDSGRAEEHEDAETMFGALEDGRL